jgi:16S rRNA (adenine1518-N6/adenine1519-N6)-dimethyltransferase
LRIIGELESKPLKTVLLIQKEVAQRICAKSPHSSLLSLSVQFWAEPKIIASVPAKDFLPPPEVSSSVIVLDAIRKENDAVGRAYYLFIKAAFKHPRKTLYNNLLAAGFSGEEIIKTFDSLGIEHGIRASVLEEPEAEKMGRILYLQS